MIVTIDGPAGAGKSTAARRLAERLGFDFLDTGAMYRCVTLAGVKANCDFSDAQSVEQLLTSLTIDVSSERVMLNEEDVTSTIRQPEVTKASGAAANNPSVRTFLVEQQRRFADGRNIVTEGRDQGTIVFPNADRKYFLDADPEERARRRWRQHQSRGEDVDYESILADQQARDTRDAERDIAPMKPAADAIILDSTKLTLNEVLDIMERDVRQCLDG